MLKNCNAEIWNDYAKHDALICFNDDIRSASAPVEKQKTEKEKLAIITLQYMGLDSVDLR